MVGGTQQDSPETFTDLAMQPANVEFGAQGGRHIWAEARMRGVCTSNARAQVDLLASGQVGASGQSRRGAWSEIAGQAGTWRTNAIQVFMLDDRSVCLASFAGTLEVRLTVEDGTDTRTTQGPARLVDSSFCQGYPRPDAGADSGASDAASEAGDATEPPADAGSFDASSLPD